MKETTFAERIISYCSELDFTGTLPQGITLLNPYRNNADIRELISVFYNKYYNDNNNRHLILGINPGRFGAGVTGIPFTDTRRLKEKCEIDFKGFETHETSSVFIYEMIDAFGGPELFYSRFFIGAVSPLGFTCRNKKGNELNYNYYDSRELQLIMKDFICDNIKRQIALGIVTNKCFCLGTGRNFKYLSELNSEHHFFDEIVALEHPRFIMQYRSRQKQEYIGSYLRKLASV